MESAKGLPWDQRPPRDHTDGGPFEERDPLRGTPEQADEQPCGSETRSRACAVPRSLRTNHRLPGMLGSATRISLCSGLQNTTTRVARAPRDRRNANIETRIMWISAGVSNDAREERSPTETIGGDPVRRRLVTRQDQNVNSPNWTTIQSRQTNINELRWWITTRLDWEVNK